MTDWNALGIERLDREPGPPWEVIPGQFTPPSTVCGVYQTAGAAHAALLAAGYATTGQFIASPPLVPHYDQRTVMRFCPAGGDPLNSGVLLVRRAPS